MDKLKKENDSLKNMLSAHEQQTRKMQKEQNDQQQLIFLAGRWSVETDKAERGIVSGNGKLGKLKVGGEFEQKYFLKVENLKRTFSALHLLDTALTGALPTNPLSFLLFAKLLISLL